MPSPMWGCNRMAKMFQRRDAEAQRFQRSVATKNTKCTKVDFEAGVPVPPQLRNLLCVLCVSASLR